MDHRPIHAAAGPLLAWYRESARDLPWRHTRDPYRIWVSEIMLQQTRVAAVLGYYARFLEAFPTVEALAAGREERLLSLWQGLGYYSRARNLKRAAERIVKLGGFPDTYEALRALPGVGDYTAGAIASAAYGLPRAAVDGNVLRVLSRLADWHEPVTSPAARRTAAAALEAAFPGGEDAYLFNQAWMELGAVVCVPNGRPLCGGCPAAGYCLGRERGTAEALPVRETKRPRRVEARTVFLLLREARTEARTAECPEARTEGQRELRAAVRKRPARGLLAGLWEFPNVPGTLDEAGAAAVLADWGFTASDWHSRLTAKHIFTHVEWHMTGYVVRVSDENAADGGAADSQADSGAADGQSVGGETGGAGPFVWIDRRELDEYAVPSAFARFRERAADLLDGAAGGAADSVLDSVPDGAKKEADP